MGLFAMSQFAVQEAVGDLPRGALAPSPGPRLPRRCRHHRLAVGCVLTGVALLLLAGCGDRILETGLGIEYFFGDEKPPIASPVARITETDTTYPNLAQVPPRPITALPEAERPTLRTALERDLATGQDFGARLRGGAPAEAGQPAPAEPARGVVAPTPGTDAAEPSEVGTEAGAPADRAAPTPEPPAPARPTADGQSEPAARRPAEAAPETAPAAPRAPAVETPGARATEAPAQPTPAPGATVPGFWLLEREGDDAAAP